VGAPLLHLDYSAVNYLCKSADQSAVGVTSCSH
jgi:hypothetical protein